MNVFVAKYEDGMYPEDNKIVGIFMSEAAAERAIDNEIKYRYDPKYPAKHLSNRFYYSIEEHEVYD